MHRAHSQQSLPARTLARGLFGLGLAAALGGCAAGRVGGSYRSQAFPSGNAPEPTIATTVLTCAPRELTPGAGDAVTAQFNALARTAMPSPPVALSPDASGVLCNTVAESFAFHRWRETPLSGSASVVIRELAQATGAKAIAMPALRLYPVCQRDPVRWDRLICSVGRRKDVGLFLFAADGTILYGSTKEVG